MTYFLLIFGFKSFSRLDLVNNFLGKMIIFENYYCLNFNLKILGLNVLNIVICTVSYLFILLQILAEQDRQEQLPDPE